MQYKCNGTELQYDNCRGARGYWDSPNGSAAIHSDVPGYQDFALDGRSFKARRTPRALSNLQADDSVTIEVCLGFFEGYNYVGVEYGRDCWLGNTLSGGTVQSATAAERDMPCSGSPLQYRGSGNHLLPYSAS
ncbi:hypothetical protein MAPG_02350 [Magnaporthiopsis poae ATCC 64411]|uniref:WSC domain-containing protein n=1 Tax=Magnaporthiopsis poae (strain ATCC 64411 / 73-15) TaxID=644358 RepID=A0A0C4DR48_MAGP6|nr:hypothetical protein MAPG_02350 [Magnaporthiopsis poae ATCC 64411]